MTLAWVLVVGVAAASAEAAPAALDPALRVEDSPEPLALSRVGSWQFRVLSPRVLEVALVQTADRGRMPAAWDFSGAEGRPAPPPARAFAAAVNGRPVAVRAVGFLRRVLYAPLGRRDLRVETRLSFELDGRVPDGATVELQDIAGVAWGRGRGLVAMASPTRESPAIHVSAAGYATDLPKRARVGRWLGSLGDLTVDATTFRVVDAGSGREVHTGRLVRRPEQGLVDSKPYYQAVLEADLSAVTTPGTFRVEVPGLGRSAPFRVHEGVPAAYARAFALGLFHQRCGEALALPFTRFAHGACHLAPAGLPEPGNASVRRRLAEWTARESGDKVPRLDRVEAALYPPVRPGPVDVRGGHHDAGDYGKYTWNSASLVHALVFAADVFPGVADLDNLGLPESGNGASDLIDEAVIEARFLARMQDEDGGFFTLVQPRDRPYENDVPPDRGDPQVVFPKTVIATAAAVAALAQAGSSPRVRRVVPAEAAEWMAAALRGWDFLERAWRARGREGANQPLHHYGGEFDDRDEVAWAATELYLATGEDRFHQVLLSGFDPADPATLRWRWIRLAEAYGNAIRSYAFADRAGRVPASGLDAAHLAKCRAQVLALAEDVVRRTRASAWGAPLPLEAKRHRTIGWHFSSEPGFDLAAAHVLDPRPEFLEAMAEGLAYQCGANPLDVCFIPGLGRRFPRDPVSAFALVSPRALPPTGVPVGDIVAELSWLPGYEGDLRRMRSPAANDPETPFPMYERWADSWNVTAEATVPVLGRSLGAAAFLMARSPVASRPWRPLPARIDGVPTRTRAGMPFVVSLEVPGIDTSGCEVFWDVSGHEPEMGRTLVFTPVLPGTVAIEAEARWPDGRRAFARAEVVVEGGR